MKNLTGLVLSFMSFYALNECFFLFFSVTFFEYSSYLQRRSG
jgi:hypothetical protein